MKRTLGLILLTSLVVVSAAAALAQEGATAAQRVESLRAQLRENQAKEDALKAKAQELDEALKPENIERSLAGVGSTRPEELRELRRRQLTIERTSVQNQLELLATNRNRLESAILRAEAEAYQQSAQGNATSLNQMTLTQYFTGPRFVIGALAVVFAIAGIVLITVFRRRN